MKKIANKTREREKKSEALLVQRFITDILVSQLSIPSKQIVNDTSFWQYTGSKRPFEKSSFPY